MTHRFTNAKLRESQPTLGAGKAPRNAPLATAMRKTLEEQARHSRNERSSEEGLGPSSATPEKDHSKQSIPAQKNYGTSGALNTFVRVDLSGEVGPPILWNKVQQVMKEG